MTEPGSDPTLNAEYVGINFKRWDAAGDEGEPSTFLRFYKGKITVPDEDGDRETIVGSIRATYVDHEGARIERMSIYDVFDHTQATFDFFEALYNMDSGEMRPHVLRAAFQIDFPWTQNLLIIDRLIVNPKYRGHGLGLAAMRVLMLALRAGAGVMAIKVFPLQFEGGGDPTDDEYIRLDLGAFTKDENAAVAKLQRLYAQLGFRRVPKTPYMVRDAQLPLPTIDKLRKAHRLPPRVLGSSTSRLGPHPGANGR